MNTRTAIASQMRKPQAGLSMVELALALATLGVALVLVVHAGAGFMQRRAAGDAREVLERVELAARAFAFVNARLPCPAADTRGLEACNGSTQGYVPYRTLGLPDASAAGMRFRLDAPQLARAGAGGLDVLVPVVAGERGDLLAEAVPLQAIAGAGNDHTLDFCAALGRHGDADPSGADAAATGDATGSGSRAGDAAFYLDAPAGLFQGFGWPSGAGPSGREVGRARLFSDLNCGGLLATAGRAHFNARLDAAVMRRSLQDYQTQFNIGYGLYEWDFSQSVWFVANSSYSAVKTAIKFEIARSAWFASLETNPEPATAMALAAATLITAALHTSVYASNVARGRANLSNARNNRQTLDGLVADAESLERELAGHTVASSASFLFLPQQAWSAERAQAYVTQQAGATAAPAASAGIDDLGQKARDYVARLNQL